MASNFVTVEVVNCDLCEVNRLNWMRGADSAKRLVFLRKRQFPPAGYCVGTVEDALASGWRERDYGVVCPPCITKEHEQERRDEEEEAESVFLAPSPEAVEKAQADLDEQNAIAAATGQKEIEVA